MSRVELAVIGLGAMGCAALNAAARRGIAVAGFERFTPGHQRGSSHGESRIIRLGYHEHPSYVPLLRAAYAGWRALEARAQTSLLTITGIVEAGPQSSAIVAGALAACRLHGLPHEVLDARGVNARFPAFSLPQDYQAVFQPEGGFVRPEAALSVMSAEAVALGARLHVNASVTLWPDARHVRIETDAGHVDAARVIVTAGAWTGALLTPLAPFLSLQRMTLGWFQPRAPAHARPERMPVFILETGEGPAHDAIYGFPDFAGTGVKAASHVHGAALRDGDALNEDGSDAALAGTSALLASHISGASGALLKRRSCIYTNTPDGDFVLGRLRHAPVSFASACSGHGFKFAPVIGDILCDLALGGGTAHDITRFAPGRFAGLEDWSL